MPIFEPIEYRDVRDFWSSIRRRKVLSRGQVWMFRRNRLALSTLKYVNISSVGSMSEWKALPFAIQGSIPSAPSVCSQEQHITRHKGRLLLEGTSQVNCVLMRQGKGDLCIGAWQVNRGEFTAVLWIIVLVLMLDTCRCYCQQCYCL